MQLKKINQDHYVVVTDEPIKEDCYALHSGPLGEEEIVTANGECKLDKKIVASTPYKEWDYPTWVWDKIVPLDLSYIKSLVEKTWDDFGVYMFDTQPKDTWEVEFDENNNLKLK